MYNSFFNITEDKIELEHYTDSLEDGFSFIELKDTAAEVLTLSNNFIENLGHEIYAPNIIKTYRKLSTEKSQTDG